MPSLGSSGSVRGPASNGHPYREPEATAGGNLPPQRATIRPARWLEPVDSSASRCVGFYLVATFQEVIPTGVDVDSPGVSPKEASDE
jgi:hypothetical protein